MEQADTESEDKGSGEEFAGIFSTYTEVSVCPFCGGRVWTRKTGSDKYGYSISEDCFNLNCRYARITSVPPSSDPKGQ